jgi:hypothetical protein
VGEKEIVQDGEGQGGGAGTGNVGGGSAGTSGGGGTGAGTTGGGTDKPLGGGPGGDTAGGGSPAGGKGPGASSGGGPGGDSAGGADDCFDIEMKRKDLLAQLEEARKINQAAGDEAVDAFYGKYKDAVQAAKIDDAVVSSNNAVGEAMIDLAIKAAKTFGGEKTQVSEIADKAQEAKDKYLPALKQWMHDGATAGQLDAAKKAYVDFAGSATRANIAAGIVARLKAAIEALDKAKPKNCPDFGPVPSPMLQTFEIGEFGKGAEKKQDGPMIHQGPLGGSDFADDLFAKGGKDGLSFKH